jgi:hypothetical protein
MELERALGKMTISHYYIHCISYIFNECILIDCFLNVHAVHINLLNATLTVALTSYNLIHALLFSTF